MIVWAPTIVLLLCFLSWATDTSVLWLVELWALRSCLLELQALGEKSCPVETA